MTAEISRDPLDFEQALSETNIPTASRCSSEPCSRQLRTATTGPGLYPKKGDFVRISTPSLGVLDNKVTASEDGRPGGSASPR